MFGLHTSRYSAMYFQTFILGTMKKSTGKPAGNKSRQINTLHKNAPDQHDDPQRRQPPTPQDIQRVQPVSQAHHKNEFGKKDDHKSRKGPK